MGLAEVSIMNHIALVLLLLWIFSSLGWCHPFVFFISLLYLYKVNERYSLRLRRRIQFEERKYANHRRLLSDPESVRWLNQVVEKIWPICMEQIASQQLLLPIIPWFLDKYKPWTARKAIFQHLYLGRTPPTFTGIRVLREADGDDDMVLELGMNFLSAEDMMGILAVQLRKRLGFGMWAKMHVTGMHVEGKVLVGVKFIPHWPFLGRVRVCFVEPPYFQMTVKPIFHHGVDVTELPGIAGWLDKILAVAFEQTLVEPNMLVVDVEKFASATTESWFTVDEKRPIAFVKVEIVEAADMKPSNINGHADPYVKGQLGPYRFRTKTQKKTLAPKWREEFKIPVSSWEAPNVLAIQVCHKDIFDDTIGDCLIKISNLRGGQRHDKWLTLQNTKTGRLHLAITVLEGECEKNSNMGSSSDDEELSNVTETPRSSVMAQDFNTDVSSEECRKVSDEFEPINIEGQRRTGIWVHHPGSVTSTTWQARKGRDHHPETQLHNEDCECCSDSSGSVASACTINNNDEETDGSNKIHRRGTVRTGLHKIGLVFHKSSKNENSRRHGAKGGISVRFTEDNGHARDIGDRKVNQRKHSEAGNEQEGIQEVRSRPSIRNG